MNWSAARIAVLVVAVVATLGAFGAFLFLDGSGDDRADAPVATTTPTPTDDVLTADPGSVAAPSPTTTPTPTATATPSCEDATTRFNEDGEQNDSLLPDCGEVAVTQVEEKNEGLGLACGGEFPVILYKSTTSGARTSVCGKTTVGDNFRVVVKPTGQDPIDMDGTYAWQADAFVGESGGTKYALHGVDGSLHITRGGKTTVQKSSDWISLDNEVDDGD